MEKSILLIDMNSYFASVEQACNPGLRGRPVVVCGEGRTVVTTASYEAREYGVKTGMTLFEAKRLCRQVIPVIGNLDKYIDTSLRIHKIFLDYTEQVEVFSIDECFLDVTEYRGIRGDAVKIAVDIKKRIKEELNLNCSVGIGPNKAVAKIAAKMQKPDGLTVIRKKDIEDKFFPLPVEKLQGVGIGRKISEKLINLGIKTVGGLGRADLNLLKSCFGVMGIVYKEIGQGKFESKVKTYTEKDTIKSVGHSHTMARDTFDLAVIKSYLQMLCEKTAVRLRKYGLKGRAVTLVVRFSDFEMFVKRRAYNYYFSEGTEILGRAWDVFEKKLPLCKKARLVGISVSGLVPDNQDFIFEEMRKRARLMKAVDGINRRHGDFTIRPASLIRAEKFGILERCGMFGRKMWEE